jgi:hypothetical protein
MSDKYVENNEKPEVFGSKHNFKQSGSFHNSLNKKKDSFNKKENEKSNISIKKLSVKSKGQKMNHLIIIVKQVQKEIKEHLGQIWNHLQQIDLYYLWKKKIMKKGKKGLLFKKKKKKDI